MGGAGGQVAIRLDGVIGVGAQQLAASRQRERVASQAPAQQLGRAREPASPAGPPAKRAANVCWRAR